MHSKVRMIVGSVDQAMSSTCIVSCLADLYILYALSIHSLHYVLVSDVCSVSGDSWVLSIQP